MQPVAQTTTRGILAVSAGTLEVLLQYILLFTNGNTLTITLFREVMTCPYTGNKLLMDFQIMKLSSHVRSC